MFNHSRIPRHLLLEQPNLGASLGRKLGTLLLVLFLGVGVGMGISQAQQDVRSTCAQQTR